MSIDSCSIIVVLICCLPVTMVTLTVLLIATLPHLPEYCSCVHVYIKAPACLFVVVDFSAKQTANGSSGDG